MEEIKLENIEILTDSSKMESLFEMFRDAIQKSDFMVFGEISEKSDVEKIFANKNLLHYILYIESVPVGYCQVIYRASSYELGGNAKINAIALLSQYRGKGLAEKLLQFSIADLKDKGVGLIYLDVVSENTRAKVLYEKNGLVKTGVLPRAYRKNDELFDIETYHISFGEKK